MTGHRYNHASYTLSSISSSIFTIHTFPPSLPSTIFPHTSQLSSHCCAFPINWCITSSSAPEGETTLASAPATEGALKDSKTFIHLSHLNRGSHLLQLFDNPTEHASNVHVEHGPSKKSYASIVALDLNEATSLSLNPHLHHLLLTEFGIADIQACEAALSDPDTLTYDQVLSDPDIEEWKKSAHKEITQLESKDTWVEVPTSEATSKILPGTWVFHCKRAPTGIITKFKARYCVQGDLQEDALETYAPVVSWSTIRLVLVFTLTQSWISSLWTPTMPSSKLTSQIHSG